jgi:hypothetical protein
LVIGVRAQSSSNVIPGRCDSPSRPQQTAATVDGTRTTNAVPDSPRSVKSAEERVNEPEGSTRKSTVTDTERELLVAVAPPKAVAEMSDEDLDRFVDAIYDLAKERLSQPLDEHDA